MTISYAIFTIEMAEETFRHGISVVCDADLMSVKPEYKEEDK